MYVTAKCTCLVLVRKKTQKQTHVHHCDCTARSNDSKWKKRPPRANGCSLWIQNQNWHSHPISTFLCTVFVQERSLNGFPKSWRLKSTSSRIMFFVSRARKTIVEGPIPVLAKGFSCLRLVSSWFHHSFIMVSSSFNLLANSGKVEHRVFWSNDKCRQTAQGEPIGAMLAVLKAAFESWTFLENYNELNI